VKPDEARSRIRALGFTAEDTSTLVEHFLDADRRGKPSHGVARIDWLETLPALDPTARPRKVSTEGALERWDGAAALGYLTLAAICREAVERPPDPVRVVSAAHCFPTGALGYWVRQLADAGLVAVLTTTSPARLPHPAGGPPLVGTNPLAIGLPSEGGKPIVVDVSMGKVTHGDVLRGVARAEDLVPFGGEQAHKAFALAVGLQGLVASFVGDDYGAILLVAQPSHGFADAFREVAAGLRLPGDA
jgi:L-2-hydroxycarboxylate dehydrogenase (NAD+)